MQKAVEIKNLIKDYESFRVLKGFSFEIFQGEIFGLIGPNAAGKTVDLIGLLAMGALPFIAADIFKTALAAAVTGRFVSRK